MGVWGKVALLAEGERGREEGTGHTPPRQHLDSGLTNIDSELVLSVNFTFILIFEKHTQQHTLHTHHTLTRTQN
jgi:hypothetical protein